MAGINRTTGKATDLITFSRASGGTYLDSDGLLKTAPTNIPRIDYAADGTVKGLLIEEQRTNNVTNSEACEFVAQVSGTVTTSTTPAPFGLSSVVKRVQASVLDSGARLSVPVLVGGDNHSSVYVRSRTGADQSLKITSSGTVGATQVAPASGDWVRLGVTASLGAGSRDVRVLSVGDAIDLDIALPQTELGTFPTSYIPTSGATATRAADIASISVDSFGYRQDAGTVVVECATFIPASQTNGLMWQATDGTANNRIEFGQSGSGDTYPRVTALFRVNNVTTDSFLCQTSWVTDGSSFEAVGFAYKSGSSILDTTTDDTPSIGGGTIPSGITTVGLLHKGHIKSIAYYPRRLSNAQLQALTA